ncbi:MAG: hypothetical protein KAI47_25550 [Deltaproteobacteria bacterium]|nr:hypothetical protein [Deltaproteobacteria bacterium]
MAVFEIQTKRVKLAPSALSALSDYLANRLGSSGAYQVVPRDQIKIALRQQKKKSYKSCYKQSCQLAIGQELSADMSLASTIMKIGKKCVLTVALYDLKKATTDKGADAEGKCSEEALMTAVKIVVAKLSKRGSRPINPVVLKPIPPSGSPIVDGHNRTFSKLQQTLGVQLRMFWKKSKLAALPEVRATVPVGYKIIGGGARMHWAGAGSLLTASYPSGLRSWDAAGKDHLIACRAAVEARVTAIYDPSDLWDVRIFSRTSRRADHPTVTVRVPKGYVMLGGGARVKFKGAGSMLTASYPSSATTWTASAKDHGVSSPARVTAYAIGIRRRQGRMPFRVRFFNKTSKRLPHPSVVVSAPEGVALVGGGARVRFKGPGSLLFGMVPVLQNGWRASAKDHKYACPARVSAYAIGLFR